MPWRRRLKGSLDSVPDLPGGLSGLGDDPISMILGIIALVILIPFLVVALIAGLELLILLLVFPFALLGRVLLGRHWIVEVRCGWRPWSEEEAGDWQASGLRIHEVADRIRRGDVPPQTLGHTRN